MKLYTKEQLRQMFYDGIKYAASIVPASMGEQDRYVQNTIDSFTPIELPSDEHIYNISRVRKMYEKDWGFIEGAKWMKEQILNQNK